MGTMHTVHLITNGCVCVYEQEHPLIAINSILFASPTVGIYICNICVFFKKFRETNKETSAQLLKEDLKIFPKQNKKI